MFLPTHVDMVPHVTYNSRIGMIIGDRIANCVCLMG